MRIQRTGVQSQFSTSKNQNPEANNLIGFGMELRIKNGEEEAIGKFLKDGLYELKYHIGSLNKTKKMHEQIREVIDFLGFSEELKFSKIKKFLGAQLTLSLKRDVKNPKLIHAMIQEVTGKTIFIGFGKASNKNLTQAGIEATDEALTNFIEKRICDQVYGEPIPQGIPAEELSKQSLEVHISSFISQCINRIKQRGFVGGVKPKAYPDKA